MSEPIWCSINFKTPLGWFDDDNQAEHPDFPVARVLREALLNGDDDVSLCDPGKGLIPNEPGLIWNFNGEGNYGLMDEDVEWALNWLREHKVPFVATDDTKYDMVGTIIVSGPGGEFEGRWNEEVVMSEQMFRAIQKAWDHAPVGALSAITDYFDRLDVDINEMAVSHLPAVPPKEDE